jgi:hypothetical protein
MKIGLTDQPNGGSAVIDRDGRHACVEVDLKMVGSPNSNRFTSFWEVCVCAENTLYPGFPWFKPKNIGPRYTLDSLGSSPKT